MAAGGEILIGEWRFEASSNRLFHGDERVDLEPLPARVLEFLAARPGEVVSADELVEALWPRKFVGDSPVYRIIAELRRALGDDAQHPRYIETIRKRGYRLVAETRPVQTGVSGDATESGPATKRLGLVATAIALLAAVAVLTFWVAGERAPRSAPQTIAVLAFEDLSHDGNDEFLGDGIAEVLIHQLSQVDGLEVIARNSSFTYKGRNVDIRDVGEALGATSVLEGSIQRGEGKLRIAAQLIDAETGSHVWSKLFDVPDDDLFAVQDDIAATVVAELVPSAPETTILPAAGGNPQLDAYEIYLLGRHKASNLEAPDALELFREAIDRDPEFGLAYVGLADALLQGIDFNSQEVDPSIALQDAHDAVARAIELAPDRPEPYASKILLATIEGDNALADLAYEQALAADDGHVDAHIRYLENLVGRAWLELNKDYLDRALELADRAERLDPLNLQLKYSLARIARMSGAYDSAARLLRDAYELSTTRGEAAQALGALAFLHYDYEQFDKAVAYFHLARDHAGDDVGVYTTYLAHSYLFLQDYSAAQRWLAEIDKPYDGETLFVYWDMLLLTGDDDRLVGEVGAMLDSADESSIVPLDYLQSLAAFFFGFTGRCDRLFDVTAQMDLEAERVRQPAADCTLAWCYGRLGMMDEAREHTEFARDYVRRSKENGMVTKIERYVEASVFALDNDRDGVLDALEAAYAEGMRTPDFLSRDLMMAQYRDDERFRRLLAGMREDIEAMRKLVARAAQEGDWYSLVDVEPLPDLR